MKKSDVIYDDNVDYDALEQHTYEDSGDDVLSHFYYRRRWANYVH